MIDMDFAKYTEAELLDLNRRLIAHVKEMRRRSTYTKMVQFRIGDKVRSNFDCRPARFAGISGEVIRIGRTRIGVRTAIGTVNFQPGSITKI